MPTTLAPPDLAIATVRTLAIDAVQHANSGHPGAPMGLAPAAWTLCSIPKVTEALHEVHRVLTPSGRLLFVEHGRSPDAQIARWQDRLTPLWTRIAGGCHLNRAVGVLIEDAGFRIERLHSAYMSGPRALTFTYEGCARPVST